MANLAHKQVPNNTLRIRSIKHLSITLAFPAQTLTDLGENASKHYREFSRDVKGKKRDLISPTGKLRAVQRRILDRILMRLPHSDSSYGTIRGKTIRDNALVHSKSSHIVKLDIKGFYPSIRSDRVYQFFVDDQGCSPDVARILTKLTTYKYAVPLGTSTSPMLADQIVNKIDKRILGMSWKAGFKYTRYVDDITISASFPLERFISLILKILKQSGFKAKKEKLVVYCPGGEDEERIITGVRVVNGKISAPSSYVQILENDLNDALAQSKHRTLTHEFMTRQHYRGQIGYVMWLDKKLGSKLLRLYRKVEWRHLEWMQDTAYQDSISSLGN
jgi:RNA-directed DNA polymerase